jgi:hypothetical protein
MENGGRNGGFHEGRRLHQLSARRHFAVGWLHELLVERLGQSRVFKDVDSIGPGESFPEKLNVALAAATRSSR